LRAVVADRDAQSLLLPDQHQQPFPPRYPRVDQVALEQHVVHRSEGDRGNSAYWYNRAGKPVCREPLDAKWLSIVRSLLR